MTQHMLLNDISSQVPAANWPKDDDRLLLTQVFEYSRDHPEEELTTRDIERVINTHKLVMPTINKRTHDKEALKRFKATHKPVKLESEDE